MSDTSDHRPLHYVVGSGPSGMACAHALLQRGARVVMLDAGITLEESRRNTIKQMGSKPPNKWTKEQLSSLKEGMNAGIKGIPLKLIYGSNYPYRDTEVHIPADYQGVG